MATVFVVMRDTGDAEDFDCLRSTREAAEARQAELRKAVYDGSIREVEIDGPAPDTAQERWFCEIYLDTDRLGKISEYSQWFMDDGKSINKAPRNSVTNLWGAKGESYNSKEEAKDQALQALKAYYHRFSPKAKELFLTLLPADLAAFIQKEAPHDGNS